MKKLRSAIKSSDKEDDSNRSALFGNRFGKKSSSDTAPASSNPYAQPQVAASPDPYAQDTNKYANMGRPIDGPGRGPVPGGASQQGSLGGAQSYGGRGSEGVSSSGYAGGAASSSGYGDAYGADKFGNQGSHASGPSGYGQSVPGPGNSRYGISGYGGLGKVADDSSGVDDNRDALFGGAKDRYQQKAQPPLSKDPNASGGPPGGYGAESSGYGTYGEERRLTAEEAEEEDVQATKQQIRFMKQEDVSSTRNALRIAAQAEETGRSTLERLGTQGERIHNTEKNLDLATNHNRIAEDKARELKTLNGSMFAVHVSNPFTTRSRKEKRDQEIMDRHRDEREARENTRVAANESRSRVEGAFKGLQAGDPGYQAKQKTSLAERAKYQFEADSEDEEMENEIDSNLDALSGAASRLNAIARATGKEVDEQNRHIERIHGKSDKVDDMINMNRKRLDRIR